jgi:hypothetical protein
MWLGTSVFGVLWMSALQQSIPDEYWAGSSRWKCWAPWLWPRTAWRWHPSLLSNSGNGRSVLVGAFVVLMVSTIVPLLQRDVRTFGGEKGSGIDPSTQEQPVLAREQT